MPEVFDELGAFVRERRKTEGLTQEALANMAGVGRRFVYELEGGNRSNRRNRKAVTFNPSGNPFYDE